MKEFKKKTHKPFDQVGFEKMKFIYPPRKELIARKEVLDKKFDKAHEELRRIIAGEPKVTYER